jgi:hypothetical protein
MKICFHLAPTQRLSLLVLLYIALCTSVGLYAQAPTQTLKGTVIDKQAGSPIPGATVILLDSLSALQGTYTDANGRWRIDNVPVGRKSIQVSMAGYAPVTRGNLQLLSGKELDVEVALEEMVTELQTVEITDQGGKHQALNQMATVSARSFSIEEAGRYSGSFSDPARMAQNFAGVSGASDDRNDIIIRGNSPTGVLWRMEGIDIPSPNHFGTLGTTGGPVSMLNINNLSNSDFMTSAFTADYGNALAGVFDLKLRNGNADKREYLAQVGFNGFEGGIEGPFKKGGRASYLANYRYSMLAVASALGLQFGTGASVPYYQDLTFKLNFPTTKAGTFSVFGVGGISDIEFLAKDAGDNNLYTTTTRNANFGSNTGFAGVSHTYFFDDKTYSKLVLAVSGTLNDGSIDSILPDGVSTVRFFGSRNSQVKTSLNYKFNRKFNVRNTLSLGLIGDRYQIDVLDSVLTPLGSYRNVRAFDGSTYLVQGYANWLHRFSDALSMTLGLHSQHFLLNKSNALEPRLGLRYKLGERQNLNFGAGMHSQLQPLTVYFVKDRAAEPAVVLPNKELDFTRALHGVVGYDLLLSESLRIKAETYYQYLYNVPVNTFSSPFSMLNAGRDFVLPNQVNLENTGTGYNYGFELTLERFFSQGYYFLGTASLFQSRYTPIDLAASQAAGTEVNLLDQSFEARLPEYFRADFKTTFRMNFPKFAQQFSVDLQNISNHQNVFQYGYNAGTGKISTTYQRGFFPDVQYKIFF